MNRQEQARHSLVLADRRARLSRLMGDAPEAILDLVEEVLRQEMTDRLGIDEAKT